MRRNLIQLFACVVFVGLIASCTEPSQAQGGGETSFKSKCAACHGPDGKGQVPMGKIVGAADLTSTEVWSQSDAQLTNVITKGKNNKMPAFDGKLSKDETADLVAFIRELGKKH